MNLPFADGSFDAVVCQFGAMFFPDRKKAFSEARRVLRAGGSLLFNVWDRIEENEFADVVTTSLQTLFPEDPPRFMRRTPHGYFDTGAIRSDLADAGFTRTADIVTLAARSRADSPRVPAIAYCQGTPLQNEIAGPRPFATWRSDRYGGGGDRPALRPRRGGRKDPGARHRRRKLISPMAYGAAGRGSVCGSSGTHA